MTESYPHCQKCNGKILREGTRHYCLNCGQEWKTLTEKGSLYKYLLPAIKLDLQTMPRQAVLKKFQIPASSLSSLLKRRGNLKPEPPPPTSIPDFRHFLPPLPPFSNDWPPQVQEAWIQSYANLITIFKLEEDKIVPTH